MTFPKIFASKEGDDLFNVCNYLLKNTQINFTEIGLQDTLRENIDYPSLLAVKDTLTEYSIDSRAIRKGRYSYYDFEVPFICAIQKPEWPKPQFTVVTKAEGDGIQFLNPTTNKVDNISVQHFERLDKDIILMLDTTLAKDEKNFYLNKKRHKNALISRSIPLFLIVIAILLSINQTFLKPISLISTFSIAFLFTSLIGLIISTLLVIHDIDEHNPFIKEVCGGDSAKLNCSAVLSSSKSSFGGISWSAWGFAFFACFFTSEILFPNQLSNLILWSYISLIGSMYIFFSIYYQWKIVKQWCPLCLGIQTILFFNLIISIGVIYNTSNILQSLNIFNIGITALLGFTYLYFIVKAIPIIKSAADSKNYEKKWSRLRHDSEIFNALLEKSDLITISAGDLGIVLGNPNATNEIVKVCNPYCGPCSKAHPELESLIAANSDLKVRIIFTASGEDDDKKTAPVAHLLALQDVLDGEELRHALDDWYLAPEKNYELFASKYPLNVPLIKQKGKIQAMYTWCEMMKIRATPTIYINGRELPESYSINELKNFF